MKHHLSKYHLSCDKDDSDEKGYRHACKRLLQLIPSIKIDLSKSRSDFWSFGLHIYQLVLPESVSCNLLNLIPEKFDNDENRPYWFTFKRLPTFRDAKMRDKKAPKEIDPARKGTSVSLNLAAYADLSYGALISMNRFCYSSRARNS